LGRGVRRARNPAINFRRRRRMEAVEIRCHGTPPTPPNHPQVTHATLPLPLNSPNPQTPHTPTNTPPPSLPERRHPPLLRRRPLPLRLRLLHLPRRVLAPQPRGRTTSDVLPCSGGCGGEGCREGEAGGAGVDCGVGGELEEGPGEGGLIFVVVWIGGVGGGGIVCVQM